MQKQQNTRRDTGSSRGGRNSRGSGTVRIKSADGSTHAASDITGWKKRSGTDPISGSAVHSIGTKRIEESIVLKGGDNQQLAVTIAEFRVMAIAELQADGMTVTLPDGTLALQQ